MPYDGEIRKADHVEIARNTQGTPTAKLIAVLIAAGITDTKELAEIVGLKIRAVQATKNALQCAQQNAHVDASAAECAHYTAPAQQNAPETQHNAFPSRAYKELPSEVVITKNNTPGDAREGLDQVWAKAMELGNQIKGGKVAKSARAIRSAHGELDGSRGIEARDGKLTITGEAAAELETDFPGVSIRTVANKSYPEVRRFKHPSYGDAMAVLRKWAEIEEQNRHKPRQMAGAPLEHRIPENVVKFARPALDEVANA